VTSLVLRPIQLIVETGTNNMIPFLDILVSWKFANTGCYLNYQSNHPPHVKQGTVESFIIDPKPNVKKTKC